MVTSYETVTPSSPEPGVTRRVIAHGGKIMGVEVRFEKGAVGSIHKHFHEQMSYIVSGSFEYFEDGKKYLVKAGDSYYVPADVEHGVIALEESVILDVFTPQRDDFL